LALALALPLLLVSCRTVERLGSATESVTEAWDVVLGLGPPSGPRTDYQLPAAPALCGEHLPIDRPAVREKLEYEFLVAVNHQAQVELWRRRAQRYFPLIEKTLREAGLPDDLKYLAVAESDLRPAVSSPAGASGLWQFMPATARRFGIPVDKNQDQRLLPEPLLGAGTRYLSALKSRFGSWALAMAAYNAGEARIGSAISKQGTNDYYELDLVTETSRYIYRIAAIKIILEGAERYGFDSRPEPGLYTPMEFDEVALSFPEPKTWATLAKEYHCDYKTLRRLNPHLSSKPSLKGGPWPVRLPRNRAKTVGT
jgi:hypothetical protein